jgi:NTP pyrophosphatase (non-canonical NTP hydrolase)
MYSVILRGENRLGREEIERKERNYRIDIGAYGSIAIEAPTKEECLELFREVTSTKRCSKIDEAIR